jgi:hypothetical protein
LVVSLLVACSSKSGGEQSGDGGITDGPDDAIKSEAGSLFAGTWGCSGTYSLVYTAPPQAAGTYYGKDVRTYSIVDDGNGTITATTTSLSGDAGAPCVSKFMVSGTTATLASGQSCSDNSSGTTIQEAFTSGTLDFGDASSLALTLKYNFTGTAQSTTLDGGTSTLTVGGTGTDEDPCSKQ